MRCDPARDRNLQDDVLSLGRRSIDSQAKRAGTPVIAARYVLGRNHPRRVDTPAAQPSTCSLGIVVCVRFCHPHHDMAPLSDPLLLAPAFPNRDMRPNAPV